MVCILLILCCIPTYDGCLRGQHLGIMGVVNQTSYFPISWNTIFKWKKTLDKLWLLKLDYQQTWFWNESSEPITSRKIIAKFVANDKNWAFEQKLEFWKTYICHPTLDSFSPDETGGDINNWLFWYGLTKWVYFEKVYLIPWTYIFQMTSVWCF